MGPEGAGCADYRGPHRPIAGPPRAFMMPAFARTACAGARPGRGGREIGQEQGADHQADLPVPPQRHRAARARADVPRRPANGALARVVRHHAQASSRISLTRHGCSRRRAGTAPGPLPINEKFAQATRMYGRIVCRRVERRTSFAPRRRTATRTARTSARATSSRSRRRSSRYGFVELKNDERQQQDHAVRRPGAGDGGVWRESW